MTDNFRDILQQCSDAIEEMSDASPKKKTSLYSELNDNLILFAEVLAPMIGKMILYQTTSIENPYLIKEINRIERQSRKLFNQAGVLSQKLGKPNHDKFINTFDHGFTKELSKKYQKLLRNNTIFSKI